MTRGVAVRVPASSANLGPGFDTFAAALDLHLELEVRDAAAFAFSTALPVARDRRNLAVRSFARIASPERFAFSMRSTIPLCGGLGSSAAAVVAGLLAAARLGERMTPAGAAPQAAVPAMALSLALVVPVVTAISNQLSRDVERRADAYALRLTGEPATLVAFQRRIAIQNVSDPEPPRLSHALLGTHPTTLERIGLAEAFSPREGGSPAAGRPEASRGGS